MAVAIQTITMADKRTRKAAAILLLGCCTMSFLLDLTSILPSSPRSGRRSLQVQADDHQPADADGHSPVIYPWARKHLRPLSAIPEPSKETILFWHIPKSGGTTVKSIYECLGKPIANHAGVDPRYGHQSDEEIIAFKPWPGVSKATYVNVDTTNRQGILRAERLGLVTSGVADMIVTSEPTFAIEHLYDESHKGRVLAMFRNPIDRLVSKFYYLQKAKWEKQYRPQWKNIDVLEFARKRNIDNNHMVKKLAGLGMNETATEDDLRIAMRTMKKRFIVGLMDQMEESIHRFNIVLGVDESVESSKECMDHFFHHSLGAKKHNSNAHPQVAQGSPTWNALAKRNALDMRLYDFIIRLFDEQRETIESYTTSSVALE